MMADHRREDPDPTRSAGTIQLLSSLTQGSSQLTCEVRRVGGLGTPVHLAQSAPLVKGTAQLLDRGVGMRVPDGSRRGEGLSVPTPKHVDRQHPVLGIGDLPKTHTLPRGPRYARVCVGKE